jgi:hypothetical protein
MSEEQEQGGGFFSNLKNQIITGAGVLLTTLGGFFMDEVKGILGISEDEGGAKTEMVQQQQQSQSNNQQVIINIPEQKPAPVQTRTVVKEVPAKPVEKKKEKEEELDW